MVRRGQPLGLTPQTRPPPDDPDSADGGQKRPAREKSQLPDKEEVRRLINELHSELTSDNRATVREATRVCEQLSLRAAERLGLIITGAQPATAPQVVMSGIAILKAAGLVGKDDRGVTAETAE